MNYEHEDEMGFAIPLQLPGDSLEFNGKRYEMSAPNIIRISPSRSQNEPNSSSATIKATVTPSDEAFLRACGIKP